MSADVRREITDYGFIYGPAEVSRLFEMDGRVTIEIKTSTGKRVTIYVSAKGRSLRVFGDGGEMHCAPSEELRRLREWAGAELWPDGGHLPAGGV